MENEITRDKDNVERPWHCECSDINSSLHENPSLGTGVESMANH